jgi:uncharacterized membrane protein YfcA
MALPARDHALLPSGLIRHHAAMDIGIVLFVVAVVLAATTAQTVAGFGFALVAVPFFVAVLDVRDAVVLTTLLGLLNNAIVARTAWRHVPWRAVGPMLTGAFAGMPLGLAVLLFAPEDALRFGVGVSTLVMAAALASGLRFSDRSVASELGVGLISGVLNTSTSMNGPPVVLYLQGRQHPPYEFRGALAVFFFACSAATLAAFFATRIVTGEALALSAAGLPAVGAGSVLGHALVRRVEPALFRRLVFVLLAVSALSAVASSLARLLA